VVNVSNGANVHVGLIAVVLLFSHLYFLLIKITMVMMVYF